ncbi:hypothetical protein CARUB_v100161550mg, partial [Capsella rubella]
PSIA